MTGILPSNAGAESRCENIEKSGLHLCKSDRVLIKHARAYPAGAKMSLQWAESVSGRFLRVDQQDSGH
jgi:hypothetical protein